MSPPTSQPASEVRLVTTTDALEELAAALEPTDRIALDIEADGLFAYRAKLCVLQIAWRHEHDVAIAIVDPLDLELAPLARILGPTGPTKILHDLTFDARMLLEAGHELGNVRDTSVAARFLGEQATGLARMVESRVGVVLKKEHQDHDWSKRPLLPEELDYLASDVRHLLDLDDVLRREVTERGIEAEVALECEYKLLTARRPPRDERPLHARIKGYGELDPVARSVLRRLVEARERLAEHADVPAFRIARSETLLQLARRKPTSDREVRRICGRDRAVRHIPEWQRAIGLGLEDEPEPKPKAPPPPPDLAERRALERTLTEWRRARADERNVDAQVVLPGHCVEPLVSALLATRHDATGWRDALLAIEGWGAVRVERYEASLRALLAGVPERGTSGLTPPVPAAPPSDPPLR